MLIAGLLLLALVVGMILGWFARDIRALLRMIAKQLYERQQATQKPKSDGSGVIVNHQPYERGQVVSLPSFDPNTNTQTGIVRARTPEQVKKDSDREWEQTLNEYR